MQLSDSIELVIGLSFLFLLLSLVLTAANEAIESVLKTRGARLYQGICELLADPNDAASGRVAAKALYRHPLVQGLMRGDVDTVRVGVASRLPSYLPTKNFALALIDQALTGALRPGGTPAPGSSLPANAPLSAQLALAAEGVENGQLREALRQALAMGGDDMDKVRGYLEAWYDSAMDRVSGGYKRQTQRVTIVLALLVAGALNVNALALADSLTQNATMRRAIVAQAEHAGELMAPGSGQAAQVRQAIHDTGLPLGWTATGKAAFLRDPVGGVFGWLLTALAISLGAPFWFDVLNRLMVIRATVKPTEKSKDEAPQDPQRKGAAPAVLVVQAPDGAGDAAPPKPPEVRDADIYNEPPTLLDRQFEDEAA